MPRRCRHRGGSHWQRPCVKRRRCGTVRPAARTDGHRVAHGTRLGLQRGSPTSSRLALDVRGPAASGAARRADHSRAVRVEGHRPGQRRSECHRTGHAQGLVIHVRLSRWRRAAVCPQGQRPAADGHCLPDSSAGHRLFGTRGPAVALGCTARAGARSRMDAAAEPGRQWRRRSGRRSNSLSRGRRKPARGAGLSRSHEPRRAVSGDGPDDVHDQRGHPCFVRHHAARHRA